VRIASRAAAALAAVVMLSACAASSDPDDLQSDPFAAQNREVHETNKQIDRAVYGPVARGYGDTVPQTVRNGVRNLRNNWRLPGHVVQYSLQGRGVDAAKSTTRFMVNTVFGFGGLIDPATDMGLVYDETNFDETFYRWGVPEGGYLELPFVGPGTQRDWTGYVLDQALDPTWYVLPVAATNTLLVLGGLDLVNDRYELDTVLDSLLYESADSYTAQRISYLQNMRARLKGGTDVDQLEDVYADF
jgi:phospholipid-binding lipoprotein MlaA